jgi:hypothetical protein
MKSKKGKANIPHLGVSICVRGQKPWNLLLLQNHELGRILLQLDFTRIDIGPCFLVNVGQFVGSDASYRSVFDVQGD